MNSLPDLEINNVHNRYFKHLLKYHKAYLLGLVLLVWLIPILANVLFSKPLLMGPETYYRLDQSQHLTWRNYFYYPLHWVDSSALILLPLLLSLAGLGLFLHLSKQKRVSLEQTVVFSVMLILTPLFMFSVSSISAFLYYTMLVLLGLVLFNSKKWKWFSLVPFWLATHFDLFSSVLLLVIIGIEIWNHVRNKADEKWMYVELGIIIAAITFNTWILNIPIQSGPFLQLDPIVNLFSDLGSWWGLPLFTALLGIIGIVMCWKEKQYSIYFMLLVCTVMYWANPYYIFPLGIVLTYFATCAFLRIIEYNWTLVSLKQISLFLLILGLLFSTLAYVNRIPGISPLAGDTKVLEWANQNFQEKQVMLALPEEGYYVEEIGGKTALLVPHNINPEKLNAFDIIMDSTYTSTTFPLLESNEIKLIFVSTAMKQEHSEDKGLRFVLQNERFSKVYSSGEAELWVVK